MVSALDVEVILGKRVGLKRIQAAQAEFERIRLKYGRLTSELVLKETQKLGKKSPIYWAFDWNVSSAARKHWLNQAGHLIREVQVRLVLAPDSGVHSKSFRMYSFVREPHGGSYQPTVAAVSDLQMREQLLQEALRDIDVLRKKYKSLSWLATALDQLGQTVAKKRSKKAA